MAKKKTKKVSCSVCGHTWKDPGKAKCENCGHWNVGEIKTDLEDARAKPLFEYDDLSVNRVPFGPWDFTFGGGLAVTSTNLIGGGPGNGKSTMLLQGTEIFLEKFKKERCLYISSEEGGANVKDRAKRLVVRHHSRVLFVNTFDGIDIEAELVAAKPKLVILDSIQGLTRDEDHQLEICQELKKDAVKNERIYLVTSQINKDEDMAGLMSMQHDVDGLFFLQKDDETDVRIFGAEKNRFGPCPNEVFLTMTEQGFIEEEDFEDGDEETD